MYVQVHLNLQVYTLLGFRELPKRLSITLGGGIFIIGTDIGRPNCMHYHNTVNSEGTSTAGLCNSAPHDTVLSPGLVSIHVSVM